MIRPTLSAPGALLLLVLGMLGSTRASAAHIFWAVHGARNTIYLLGSVHVRKPDDAELPSYAASAYAHSKAIMMELDLNQASAELQDESMLSLTALPEGQRLPQVLGPSLNQRLEAAAKPLGLEPEVLSHLQPWYVAMLFQQLQIARSGYDANSGVDEEIAARAAVDDKPVIGLETLAEQLGFFAHLSLADQKQYLASTLEDSSNNAHEIDEVVAAWQQGDTARLEQELKEGTAESPVLFRTLTTDRNRRWLPKVEALLADDHDYLVVVGALHLIGHDGLIELLRQSGYHPQQQ